MQHAANQAPRAAQAFGRRSLCFALVGTLACAAAFGSQQSGTMHAAPADPPHRFGRDKIVVGLPDPGYVKGLLVRESDGTTGGFAAELTRAAAGAVGFEVEFVPLDTVEAAIAALKAGRVDMVSPVSINEERLFIADFTVPVLIVHCAVFSREGTPAATTPEQLSRARVAVARDGLAQRWCVETGVPVIETGRVLHALQMVANGEADYGITTQLAGRNEIETFGLTGLVDRRIDDTTASRAFAFAVSRGNADLLFDMNKGLALVRDDGQWERLYDQWLERYQPRPHRTYLTREMIVGAGITLLVVTSLGLASQWILRRRLARQAELLRESEEMYRAIAENLPALAYTYHVAASGERKLRYTSPRWAEWHQAFPYLELGTDWTAYHSRIHPEDLPRFLEAARRSRADLSRFDLEFRLQAGDGSHRWLHSLVMPFRVPDGVLCQGLLLDVTPLRAAEEERQALEAQLFQAQKLEGLGVLAGGIAHDFNNLMSGVLGNLELARSNLSDRERAERHLTKAEGATQRAAELTQQLLAYAGKARLSEESIDLDALVLEMLELVRGALHPRARVSVDLHASKQPIRGDPTLVRQLAMNLLTNASDALPESGGELRVRSGVRRFEADYLARTYVPAELPAGEYVFLEVEDTGSGMDQAVLERIFDPFFTTKFAGRGLGLAVVLKTMQRHRGAVKVESEPGRGTCFRLLFPPAAITTFEPATAAGSRESVRVLVVDDEPLVRDVARTVLESRGWRVETAADGDEALRRVHAGERFDLVLLDVTMPGKGGLATLEELHERHPATPVVLMSGFDAAASNGTPPARARAFLRKPFTGRRLVQALESALAGE